MEAAVFKKPFSVTDLITTVETTRDLHSCPIFLVAKMKQKKYTIGLN